MVTASSNETLICDNSSGEPIQMNLKKKKIKNGYIYLSECNLVINEKLHSSYVEPLKQLCNSCSNHLAPEFSMSNFNHSKKKYNR